MVQSTPQLFDRSVLDQRRRRVQRDALFLHDAAREEVQDRLRLVNKAFHYPAIVTPFPEIWDRALADANVVQDTETLKLQAGAHDLVIHAMALHAANDPVGQLIQCRRALKPDGLLLGLFLGGRTLAELREALSRAEAQVTGGLSARFAPMIDIRDAGALLQRAGFALPVADVVTLSTSYRNIWHLMRDLRAMGETNVLMNRPRRATLRTVFDSAQEHYACEHMQADGRLVATFDTIAVTGWAPDASQPKPLRPGSAQTALADALRTAEIKLPD